MPATTPQATIPQTPESSSGPARPGYATAPDLTCPPRRAAGRAARRSVVRAAPLVAAGLTVLAVFIAAPRAADADPPAPTVAAAASTGGLVPAQTLPTLEPVPLDGCDDDELALPLCIPPGGQPSAGAPAPPPETSSPPPAGSTPPGSTPPGATPPESTPPGSTPPCEGPGCVPAPPSSTGDPGSPAAPPAPGGGPAAEPCGLTNLGGCVTNAINDFFRGLVTAALNPLLDLVSNTLLTTPMPDTVPGLGELWDGSWQILLVSYSLLVLVAGVVVMSYESLQTRYTIKEIAPRLVAGFLAGALSLWAATRAVEIANAVSLSVMGDGVDATTAGETLRALTLGPLNDGVFALFIGLFLVGMLVALLIGYVIRVSLTFILIVAAPITLMFHALPHTERIAFWWWKAFGGCLAIQVIQSLTLITAMRVFLAPGGYTIFGPTESGLLTLLVACALLYILFKIPFWVLSSVRIGGGRSLVGSLVRGFITYKTFGALGLRGTAARRTGAALGRPGGLPPGGPGAQPRQVRTPEMVSKGLKQAYDAERARAARRSRLPSQAPRFLQPTPQQTTHDPAVIPSTPGPTFPEFSSAPSPTATPPSASRGGLRPVAAPEFRPPGMPRRRNTHRAAQPTRAARPTRPTAVPPRLPFKAPVSPPPHLSQPVKPSTPGPSTPMFRQARPEPRIGDARPRTPSVPPVTFRPPKPAATQQPPAQPRSSGTQRSQARPSPAQNPFGLPNPARRPAPPTPSEPPPAAKPRPSTATNSDVSPSAVPGNPRRPSQRQPPRRPRPGGTT